MLCERYLVGSMTSTSDVLICRVIAYRHQTSKVCCLAAGITCRACQFPEKIAYAISRTINGPWQYKGIINEIAGNSNTNHQAIIDFKGKLYFIYHNGALAADAGGFTGRCVLTIFTYHKNGTIKPVFMTSQGVIKR